MFKTSIQYLDMLKEKRGLTSDYQAAKLLGVSRGRISNYRTGHRHFDNTMSIKVANLIESDNPEKAADLALEILLATSIERTNNDEEQSLLGGLLRRISKTKKAILPVILSGALFAGNPSDSAASSAKNLNSEFQLIYIMRIWALFLGWFSRTYSKQKILNFSPHYLPMRLLA